MYPTFDEVRDKVQQLCEEEGVSVHGSEVLGLTPDEAYEKTVTSLLRGDSFQPSNFDERRM